MATTVVASAEVGPIIDLEYAGGVLWIASQSGELQTVAVKDGNRVQGPIRVGEFVSAVATGGRSLWVLATQRREGPVEVVRLDSVTLRPKGRPISVGYSVGPRFEQRVTRLCEPERSTRVLKVMSSRGARPTVRAGVLRVAPLLPR